MSKSLDHYRAAARLAGEELDEERASRLLDAWDISYTREDRVQLPLSCRDDFGIYDRSGRWVAQATTPQMARELLRVANHFHERVNPLVFSDGGPHK